MGGKGIRSITAVVIPEVASRHASVAPTGPAPTTATVVSIFIPFSFIAASLLSYAFAYFMGIRLPWVSGHPSRKLLSHPVFAAQTKARPSARKLAWFLDTSKLVRAKEAPGSPNGRKHEVDYGHYQAVQTRWCARGAHAAWHTGAYGYGSQRFRAAEGADRDLPW